MEKIRLKIARSKSEISQAMEVRREVFIEGQSVPEDIERDGKDVESEHVILTRSGKATGTARLRVIGGSIKIERMAILESSRGLGLGGKILAFIENHAKKRGIRELILNSQWHACGFYKRFGFEERGKPFYEAGIKHIGMHKVIQ